MRSASRNQNGTMNVVNRTRQQSMMTSASVARNTWARLRGLLARKSLGSGDGLVIDRARVNLAPIPMGVHTIGMRFSIDVAFVDPSGRILRVIHSMKPYRISPLVWNCAMVLEMPEGALRRSGTEVGDQIALMASDATQQRDDQDAKTQARAWNIRCKFNSLDESN